MRTQNMKLNFLVYDLKLYVLMTGIGLLCTSCTSTYRLPPEPMDAVAGSTVDGTSSLTQVTS